MLKAELVITGLLLFSILWSCGSGPKGDQEENTLPDQEEELNSIKADSIDPYPFQVFPYEDEWVIQVPVEEKEILAMSLPLFESFGLTGNGYSWEGVILQILGEEDPSLATSIFFNSEAGAFYAIASNEKDKNNFIEIMVPIFSDTSQLAEALSQIERSSIFD